MSRARLLSLAISLFVFTSPASSQVLIPDDPLCSKCSIILRHRVTIEAGHPEAPLSGNPLQVVRDGRGNFIVMEPGGQLPAVFGADGVFRRVIGRKGEGPGEYRGVTFILPLPGDSLLVLDSELMRGTVLAPDYVTVARTIRFTQRPGAAVILDWPGRVVMNALSFTPELAGWPLHLLDLSGGVAEHRGIVRDTRGELSPDGTFGQQRTLFQGNLTGFWSTDVIQYRIARYSARGELELDIHRRPAWFSKASEWHTGSPTIAPPPFMRSATVIGDTLWTALHVPKPNWQDAWRGIRIPSSGELSRNQAPERTDLYRTRIEAIDLKSGRLIAASYISGLVINVGSDRTIVLYRTDFSGTPQLTVQELSLQPPAN